MEVVQQEKGIEQGYFVVAESPFQMDACPFDGGLALPDLADLAHGFHIIPQSRDDFLESQVVSSNPGAGTQCGRFPVHRRSAPVPCATCMTALSRHRRRQR